MRRLTEDMDQLFGQLMTGSANRSGPSLTSPVVVAPPVEFIPPLELFERDGNLIVQVDLPGVVADEVTVEVADGVLTVSGERREELEVDDEGFRRTERRYGRFARSIALPDGANADEIQAAYRDGVLEITVPLQQEQSSRRTIDVQTSQSAPGSQSMQGTQATQGSKQGAAPASSSKERSGSSGSTSSGAASPGA